jgi:FlaG/FlaF family flagellin (archaellin)
VVGVAIMIALTVVLGALVGATVTDMGTTVMKPAEPTVAFDFQFNDTPPGEPDELTVTHEAGATIDAGRVSFVVTGAEAYDHPSDAAGGTCSASTDGEPTWRGQASGTPDTVEAGSTVRLSDAVFRADGRDLPAGPVCDSNANEDHVELNGATVKLIWTSDTGGVSYVVGEWRGPAA